MSVYLTKKMALDLKKGKNLEDRGKTHYHWYLLDKVGIKYNSVEILATHHFQLGFTKVFKV
jgi:hypothetical protein